MTRDKDDARFVAPLEALASNLTPDQYEILRRAAAGPEGLLAVEYSAEEEDCFWMSGALVGFLERQRQTPLDGALRDAKSALPRVRYCITERGREFVRQFGNRKLQNWNAWDLDS